MSFHRLFHVGVEAIISDVEHRHRHARRTREAALHEAVKYLAVASRKFLQYDKLRVERSRLLGDAVRQGFRDDVGRQSFSSCEVSLSGGTTNHQGAQFKEARIESSDEQNPMNSFSAKPVENILIDEEERLDRSYMAVVINNRKISVLEVAPESIVQDLVGPIIFSLVGESRRPRRASGQFGTRHNGNRERFTTCAGNARNNSAHLSPLSR